MNIILMLHSIVRWLIVLVAIVAIVKFAAGWLRKANVDKMDRGLTSGFSGLVDLQVLLGIVYLVGTGIAGAGFPVFRIEHGITMLVAAVVAHLPMRWRNITGPVALRNNLFTLVGVLAIVFVGVSILPGGWAR